MCSAPNCFPDTVISLYNSKTVDKKEISRTVYIPVYLLFK
jgi:hypothetical protein